MDEEIINNYKKAGKIAHGIKSFAREIVKPGVGYYEICEKIENEILKEGNLAFPVNISINEIAAHETARINDERTIQKKDIVKIDFGVHIDGYVADTALTFNWEEHKKELVKASEEALKVAIETAKPGVKISTIGKAVEETAKSFGFNSIKNLSGHSLDQFSLHAGLTIPNFDNGSNIELESGMAIAIEPFVTTGNGVVIETKDSEIFSISNIPPLRNPYARKIFDYLYEERRTLPFAKRWLLKEFKPIELSVGFVELKRYLNNYPNLKEESNAPVSQSEDTLLILDGETIATTR